MNRNILYAEYGKAFRFTHLLRGATSLPFLKYCDIINLDLEGVPLIAVLNTPSRFSFISTSCISIHAPLARCDAVIAKIMIMEGIFQSTHLLRGATVYRRRMYKSENISIHAPLARCDFHILLPGAAAAYISIHAPLARCDHTGSS